MLEEGVVELYLLVSLGGIVVCFLKGRWREGLAVIAAGVALAAMLVIRGDASEGEVSSITSVLLAVGFPAWGILAVVAALRSAVPHSFWDRRKAIDDAGRRLLDAEPMRQRLGQSLACAFAGTLPAIGFMALVIVTAETSDDAQLSFIGLPIGLLSFLLGAWIGFNWLPRSKATAGRNR